jgi:transposase InsO family protein
VTKQCRALGVSTSGFYAWRGRQDSAHACEDRRLAVLVRESYERSRKSYGSPRVQADLEVLGERVSRKRVIRLMQQQGLQARVRRRYKSTTDSDHHLPVAPNLLDRRFEADAPNERWVGDTTELRVGDSGRLFLAAIFDLYSRFVVGWALSAVNDRKLVIKALEMALRRRCPDSGLLHHSDQGSPLEFKGSSQRRRVLLTIRDLEVFPLVSSNRGPCEGGRSERRRQHRARHESGERGRCPWGSTAAAVRSCSRS